MLQGELVREWPRTDLSMVDGATWYDFLGRWFEDCATSEAERVESETSRR